MSQLIVLKLGQGDFQQGFNSVTVQLWLSNSQTPIQFTDRLSPAPDLPELYRQWQSLYQALSQRLSARRSLNTAIEFDEEDPIRVSEKEFTILCQKLKSRLNQWLDASPFSRIERKLRARLDHNAEIRIILEAKNETLRRLPWHLWNFFEDYPQAELALSAQEYEPAPSQQQQTRKKVRILAVLGNSQGIEVGADKQQLKQLSGTDLRFLVEPTRRELEQYLWEQQWDIFFFAGHSSTDASGASGKMELNSQESITINDLKHALTTAISGGLKLAILNSCDGLGLARQLADLQIPLLVVMREPVPDFVAQEFLKFFLDAYSKGKPFYLAVQEAKKRLQGLEGEFPCASWLPVICQNPTTPPLSWRQLRLPISLPSKQEYPWQRWGLPLAATGLVLLMRVIGLLQPLELRAFDHLMRVQPDLGMDNRLLVVSITQADVNYQDIKGMERKGSLANTALRELLEKITVHNPSAIGLDLYRDSVATSHPELARRLTQQSNFYAVCKGSESGKTEGIKAPTEVPSERVGFSDSVLDQDDTIRRYLWSAQFGEECETDITLDDNFALSFLLAHHYLQEREGIQLNRQLKLGKTQLPLLIMPAGGYQKFHVGEDLGYQMLLNYRTSGNVAKTVSLRDILTDNFDPNLVRDRVVLIGVTDNNVYRDEFSTPFGEKMYGVFIHAQMVSQVLSAVLGDGRPLLRVWPQWAESLWIVGWGAVGVLLVWSWRGWRAWLLSAVVAAGILWGSCLLLFVGGWWVPLGSSALALVAAGGTAVAVKKIQNQFNS